MLVLLPSLQGQYFAPEDKHLVELWPTRNDELCHANALVLEEALRQDLAETRVASSADDP